MSDNFEVSTEIIDFNLMNNIFPELHDTNSDATQTTLTERFYNPIDPIHDAVFASVAFLIGLVFNALNLRWYWSVKSSTALYIRVLAGLDIAALFLVLVCRVMKCIFVNNVLIGQSEYFLQGLLCIISVGGPLFMALDRALIVAFPLSFKKHQKKLLIFKISIPIIQSASSLLFSLSSVLIGEAAPPTRILVGVASTTFVLQIVGIVSLYALIVHKIRKSTQKVQPTSQTRNQ